jgi:hypothetical protein
MLCATARLMLAPVGLAILCGLHMPSSLLIIRSP